MNPPASPEPLRSSGTGDLPAPDLTVRTPVGRRIRLRPPTPDDIGWITRACQDPTIPRFTQVPRGYTAAHGRVFVADAAQRLALGQAAHLVIVDAEHGEGLGAVGLFHLGDDPAPAEIGYWVAPWARRGGVASTACAALAAWGCAALGLPFVVARIAATNAASRAVAVTAGFVEDGTTPGAAHDGDDPVDEIRYRWPAASSAPVRGTG